MGSIEKDSEEIVVIDVNEQKAEESTVVEVVEYNLAADLETSQLVLESTGDCWASIKGSSGESVFDGVLKAGEHRFSGVAPFSLVLGKPENIAKILYDGTLVDDKNFRVKRVARFNVGEIIKAESTSVESENPPIVTKEAPVNAGQPAVESGLE